MAYLRTPANNMLNANHPPMMNCIPQETIIKNVRLAAAYVPYQILCTIFPPIESLMKGTVFPELFSPYNKMEKRYNSFDNLRDKWNPEDKISRMELLKKITATNFMKEDLSLYLNTHPMDGNALAKYNFYVTQCKKLTEKYEMHYGMLTEHGSSSPNPWQWINEPWPWEYDANFELNGEGM
ncbi:spore coat protein CotJB [Clostridium carboxidivorans]|nr:spore coat protein CotJB [Clostridium carboxidivorans]EFG88709.1 hypothetical protein CLCAR_1454 [Clostridium carboxidivorans P7]